MILNGEAQKPVQKDKDLKSLVQMKLHTETILRSVKDEEDICLQQSSCKRLKKAHAQATCGQTKKCFLLTCESPSVKKSKFCAMHRQLTDAMRKQATNEGSLDVFSSAIDNQAKATEAVEEYRRSVPANGLYSRRPLIDWGE